MEKDVVEEKKGKKSSRTLGITSLCLSVVGLIPFIFGFVAFAVLLALISAITLGKADPHETSLYLTIVNVTFTLASALEIPGLITGILSLKKAQKSGYSKALGIIGIVLSSLALLLIIILWIMIALDLSKPSEPGNSESVVNCCLLFLLPFVL